MLFIFHRLYNQKQFSQGMLKLAKCFAQPRSPLAYNLVPRQYFTMPSLSNDTWIQDINQQDLRGKISQRLGKNYLSPLKENETQYQEIRTGIYYGTSRGLITIPTRSKSHGPVWVHYVLDPGAPYTFLSIQTMKALKINPTQAQFLVRINSHQIPVKHSFGQYTSINVLGMNFLQSRRSLHYDMQQNGLTLTDHKKEK